VKHMYTLHSSPQPSAAGNKSGYASSSHTAVTAQTQEQTPCVPANNSRKPAKDQDSKERARQILAPPAGPALWQLTHGVQV
jgi:hypothetical protein